jgi:hypothetical protein
VLPAAAYEGLQADYATCAQGRGKVANNQIVAACTRLIENAAQENELVGYFHALRAIASTDRARNCNDARIALKLLKDPKLVAHVQNLQKANC